LSDVLHELGVRHNVASGLVVQEAPSVWCATVCLGKDGALVRLRNGSILVMFGAFSRSVTLKRHWLFLDQLRLVEEDPVGSLFIIDGVGDAVPVYSMDELAAS
jgi:hypothetical protein